MEKWRPASLSNASTNPNSESRNPNKPGNVNQGSRVWWDVADTMNDRGQWHTPNNFR